ncbi:MULTISPECIES: ornithine carbamoyltransferase [unclassified Oleiphilus]|uniref:ornithine carbamoyltransferase n=3 Tax=Oleiphilus TaxID=141450 RepID=UPI0007C202AA|nr:MULTISPECIES: ornithine carbamoyltransferase [unclassified Oleiphilus]KZY49600.1 ornithine carbamoyltransferase [Oleiphilus sp. HI0050]KZY78038.1 ornithine carbamoyltransferase [Oleiphilus sp. HI0068]KZY84498.1 ornithine carbamoyltransferase [Oleiphilus sp. HI0069]KZZ13829.1 ornithine carbamoyltransferase [Oleiphilus sp. HI0078]KZZ22002.1 ornithine carbamoyltransferase [Oleiphilus sp. HI0081]KZZ42495.1 ornithine carbamoyltransferase [Oleiphilus sp. HI0085]
MALRHFLTLNDLSSQELKQVIERAITLKTEHKQGNIYEPLKNRVLALIFEKSSTRTRVSFESGMAQFGGSSLFLSPRDTQLGRGEPVEDSARVLSRMVDAITIRTFEHEKLALFARHSSVPVINALTDDFHPCQLLADMQTYHEHRGSIEGKKVVWVGDGNNMCHSFINAAALLNFELVISSPVGYDPNNELLKKNQKHAHIVRNPIAAVKNADLVVTDVWASMGQEEEQKERINKFKDYQVSPELMSVANSDALFMHCLPAHRGEEISHDMLDHPSSVVWDEAENRLHSQKALLEFLLCNA